MAVTSELGPQAQEVRGLFELSIEEAADKLQTGLVDSDQATLEEITHAMILAIDNGELKPKFGSVAMIGKYTSNPPILDAHSVATWAERNGLELYHDGEWSTYIDNELEIQEALDARLQALRALQVARKERSDFSTSEEDKELDNDRWISLMVENSNLRSKISEYRRQEKSPPALKENPKSMRSLLKIVLATAIDAYAYDPKAAKSNVPTEISNAVTEKLGESIDVDTARAWLKAAAKEFPPSV